MADKAERLFRAAISAYCSLSHPTRAEAQQLEDLALPLYNAVTPETLRYVSAALSECRLPPVNLVARLCEEAPEISAPLLVRTTALSDIDLIALIARKGVGHAKVIAKRNALHPTIAALAAALKRKERSTARPAQIAADPAPALPGVDVAPGAVGVTREALRSMMVAQGAVDLDPDNAYRALREAALSGSSKLFHARLAGVLKVDDHTARGLAMSSDQSRLLTALRALELSEERAFLLMACAFPNQFPHPVSIRLFLEKFGEMDLETAREGLRGLRADSLANTFEAHRRSQSISGAR